MKKIKTSILILFSLLFSVACTAQDTSVEMADTMRSNGKIYVVIGVISIILSGILIYLISIDRKLRSIEKSLPKGK